MEYEIHADAAIKKVRPLVCDLMNHGYSKDYAKNFLYKCLYLHSTPLIRNLMNHGYSEDDARKFLYKCLGVYLNDLSFVERMFINLYVISNGIEEKDNA